MCNICTIGHLLNLFFVPSAWQELRGAVEGRRPGPAKGTARGPGGDRRAAGDAREGESRVDPGEIIPHYPPRRGDAGGGCGWGGGGVAMVVIMMELMVVVVLVALLIL